MVLYRHTVRIRAGICHFQEVKMNRVNLLKGDFLIEERGDT
nr:MAG TPA: hypothetical protein [Caudoviricetes sp.]